MTNVPAGRITLTDFAPTAADFRAEVLAGLRSPHRRLPCKFLYDERGSALFESICELPEYYLTRTELGILTEYRAAMSAFCGPAGALVELGSGSSRKTRVLLEALDSPAGYVPIDISRRALEDAAAALQEEYPGLDVLPVCADYAQPLVLPQTGIPAARRIVFFPGSTIGNFEPHQATAFLRHVGTWCQPNDRMLIGVDLEKPAEIIEPAYNDPRGVTAAFNLNLLVRANAELGADFRLDQFVHQAVYHIGQTRVEMRLLSTRDQQVRIAGERFYFRGGEKIVTEHSYKHTPARLEWIAAAAGWKVVEIWTDPQRWFAVYGLELSDGTRSNA